jgi:4-hydroxymandelate oxidase
MTFKEISSVQCPDDFEELAEKVLPPEVFAYLKGGSGRGRTALANQDAFLAWDLLPSLLPTLKPPSPDKTAQLGFKLIASGPGLNSVIEFSSPILLAPLAHQALYHEEAELAVAKAAAASSTGMVLSQWSSKGLDDVTSILNNQSAAISPSPTSPLLTQMYFLNSEAHNLSLIDSFQSSGSQAIVLTLDAAIQQPSMDAMRVGFVMPKNWFNSHLMAGMVGIPQIEWLLKSTHLPVLVKGVLSVKDALLLKQIGVHGLVVSNHGGRTVDGVPAALKQLPAIRHAVGPDYPLLFDSGVRSGYDVFKAIALGADAVMVGRLQAYALAAAGALGVGYLLKILNQELKAAMQLCGCNTLRAINADCLQSVHILER